MDRFRAVNAALLAVGEDKKNDAENEAVIVLFAIIAALGAAGLLASYFLAERPGREAARWAREKSEFTEALQFGSDERETQGLLSRQLVRAVPNSTAIVFSSNNSENRLETASELPPGSPLAERLPTAAPAACLAIRQGGPYERREDKERLVECELCGATAANSLCQPLLVGGEVIGSVLVTRDAKPLTTSEAHRVAGTISLAAPVLANLRNLAIAETRAVTDSLTGLANVRAAARELKRAAAFAGRTATPLAAILLDVDHFKRINDTFGHQVGDEVLAALGRVLQAGTRESDFAARYGGEEFLILLQDTDTESGAEVAGKLREALRQMHVPGFTGRVTASFGVASIPAEAGDGDALVGAADHALYAAKHGGRDRVCKATEIDPGDGLGPDTVRADESGHISGAG
jgi:diguanylate cyclase (GGDEF)-like protein